MRYLCLVVRGRREAIRRTGWILSENANKITRVARSSYAAEVLTLPEGVDLIQWIRVHICEVFFGEARHQQLFPSDHMPLQTPLDREEENLYKTLPDSVYCQFCESSGSIDLATNYHSAMIWLAGSSDGLYRFKVLALTDCSNAYANISTAGANSFGRSMQILLAYVRDNPPTLCLSFLDANRNLADVGTKTGGNKGISGMFIKYGRFNISFLGRTRSDEICRLGNNC